MKKVYLLKRLRPTYRDRGLFFAIFWLVPTVTILTRTPTYCAAQDLIVGGPPAPIVDADPAEPSTASVSLCAYEPECLDYVGSVVTEFDFGDDDPLAEDIHKHLDFTAERRLADHLAECTVSGTPKQAGAVAMASLSIKLVCDERNGWVLRTAEGQIVLDECAGYQLPLFPDEKFDACMYRISSGSLRYTEAGDREFLDIKSRTEVSGFWESNGGEALTRELDASKRLSAEVFSQEVHFDERLVRPNGVPLQETRAVAVISNDSPAMAYLQFGTTEVAEYAEDGVLATAGVIIAVSDVAVGRRELIDYRRTYRPSRIDRGLKVPTMLEIDLRRQSGAGASTHNSLDAQWQAEGLVSLLLGNHHYTPPLAPESRKTIQEFVDEARGIEEEHSIRSTFPRPPLN